MRLGTRQQRKLHQWYCLRRKLVNYAVEGRQNGEITHEEAAEEALEARLEAELAVDEAALPVRYQHCSN